MSYSWHINLLLCSYCVDTFILKLHGPHFLLSQWFSVLPSVWGMLGMRCQLLGDRRGGKWSDVDWMLCGLEVMLCGSEVILCGMEVMLCGLEVL